MWFLIYSKAKTLWVGKGLSRSSSAFGGVGIEIYDIESAVDVHLMTV